MGFPWKEAAEGGAGPKVPAGQATLTIAKVIRGGKQSGDFTSKGGDPQIMLIFEDDHGCECSQMVTLSDKAGWVLARIMSCAGIDLDALEAQDISIGDFADQQFAATWLVGKSLLANVTYQTDNGKEYARVEPLHTTAKPPRAERQALPAPAKQAAPPAKRPSPVEIGRAHV